MASFRKTVFCEVEFINQLCEILGKDSFKSSDFHYLKYLTSLKSLLNCQFIKLYLNMSGEEFSKLLHINEQTYKKKKIKGSPVSELEQFLYDLKWKQEINQIHIHCLPEFPTLENIDDIALNSIFLTTKGNNYCENVAQKFGITVLNILPESSNKRQLNDSGNAILSGMFSGWKDQLDVSSYSNSMIIVDNYLLNDMILMEENLTSILDKLLPISLQTVYHITIMGRISDNIGNNRRKDLPAQPRYNKIKDIIKSLRPNLEFNLSLIKTQNDFHDRTIILNNLWFGCGSGFNLFKNGKSVHSTTINIVSPFLNDSQQWCIQAYCNLVHDVDKLLKKVGSFTNDSFPCFFIGSKDNRLIKSLQK